MPVYTLRRSSTSASSFKANMGISKYLKDIPVPCKEQINKLEQSAFKTLPNSKNGPKRKEEETSLLSEATLKATQYNTKWGRKVFEEWQQQQQNTCAMFEVVGVADLKCEDVQDLTIPPEHMLPNTLNCWLSKFACEVAEQNGEVILPICPIVNCCDQPSFVKPVID